MLVEKNIYLWLLRRGASHACFLNSYLPVTMFGFCFAFCLRVCRGNFNCIVMSIFLSCLSIAFPHLSFKLLRGCVNTVPTHSALLSSVVSVLCIVTSYSTAGLNSKQTSLRLCCKSCAPKGMALLVCCCRSERVLLHLEDQQIYLLHKHFWITVWFIRCMKCRLEKKSMCF